MFGCDAGQGAAKAPGKAPQTKSAEKTAAKAESASAPLAWDFAKLPSTKWQWWLPEGFKATPQGGVYQIKFSAAGPRIKDLNLKASDVKGVRVEVSAVKIVDGKKTPQPLSGVRIRWVRKDADGAKAGDFDSGFVPKERLKEFTAADKAKPNVWSGTVAGDANWNGTIDKARVDVCFAERLEKPADGAYEVTVKSIEFLK
jgi:hypothetical protein